MRITDDVNLPEALISAATVGDLVLFVGAGASMNAPASLPSFAELAAQLAEAAGVELDKRLEPDAFIGRLCDSDPSVRDRARAIIANPNSQPNDSHRAIVRLGNACGAIRIVSTNYDEHLSAAAAELSIEIGDIYRAPAVPLGRDFTGLVYLHGHVSRAATEIVITDDDFGRAYLFDGWARRFVTDLFLNRTVLFVGYSHSDAVMKYLARGLPPTTKRFALTDTPDDPKWRDLRITPIEYPGAAEHVALTTALNEWARRLEMGQLDHRGRVHEIVSGGPPKLPAEADYLSAVLSLPAGVRAFSEKARGEEWLLWAEQQPAFLSLFTSANQTTDESQVLAQWFADCYVADAEMTDLALATLARHGPIVCARLRQAIAYAAYGFRESSPRLATSWSIIVAAALRTHDEDPEETWNLLHRPASHGASALPFLRRALQVRLQLDIERPWYLDETEARTRTKASVRWSSSKSDLKHLWEAVREGLPTVAVSALQILEQSLTDAYELLATCEPNKSWDSWSYRRSAIEPHEQDRFPSYESTLIDALRDTSIELIGSDGSIIERWLSSDFGLFRRLGLHLVTEHQAMINHHKLTLLLSGSHLYDQRSKHEVFRLLATIATELDDADRKLLLERVLDGPPLFEVDPDREEQLHERCIFDVVEWLTRYVSGWDELERAVAGIREHRPTIGVREHPDFDHWMESGSWVEEAAPFAADEFVGAFDEHGPASAVALAVNHSYSDHTFDGPTWQGACSVVQQAVESRPDVGLALLTEPVIADNPDWESDFRAALITGLGNATLADRQIEQALEALLVLVTDARLARPICDLCLSTVDSEALEHSEPVLARLDDLARAVWHTHAPGVEERDSDDWLTLGLNTWPGVLAQYWVNRVRVRWEAEGDDWHGLTTVDKRAAARLLDPDVNATRASLAIIAADTYFIFCADPAFAREQLFPLFEATTAERAPQVWKSYLHHPRANDAMLDAGFWRLLTSAHDLIANLGSEHGLERQYWWMMASICIRSAANDVDAPALFARLVEPDQVRSFVAAMADVLHDVDEAESTNAWNSWLAETIRARLSLPLSMIAAQERTAWGDMALRVTSVIALEVLELTDTAPGPLGQDTSFRDLPPDVLSAHPDKIAQIVTRRLEQMTESDWHIEHELESVVSALRNCGVSNQALRDLAEQAVRIGLYRAASWAPPAS
ncbi:SIR2 family protein [Microbacterium sp. ZW T6_19]|uniref:SIR2 family protein n=1 Tax=Microbacterium sp. ZW T6_19 TaxID=3378082 RepID=UPI0038531D63